MTSVRVESAALHPHDAGAADSQRSESDEPPESASRQAFTTASVQDNVATVRAKYATKVVLNFVAYNIPGVPVKSAKHVKAKRYGTAGIGKNLEPFKGKYYWAERVLNKKKKGNVTRKHFRRVLNNYALLRSLCCCPKGHIDVII